MQIQWNNVTWYTRVISYILLFVIFFLGFYIGGRYQDVQQIILSTSIQNSLFQNQKIPKIYKNVDLGFKITFPISWDGLKIQENKKNNSVDFYLMHNLGSYVKVFSIERFSQEDWKLKENSLFPIIKIVESNGYIFGYSLGQSDEGFVGFPDMVYGNQYQGPYYEVQTKIIPTFSLIQSPS